MIVNVITEPFALLGALFGGSKEFSSLDLAADGATIPRTAPDKKASGEGGNGSRVDFSLR